MKRIGLCLILLGLMGMLVAQTVADTTAKPVSTGYLTGHANDFKPPTPPKLPINLFKYTLSLLLVFALIYGFFYVLRHVSTPVRFLQGRSGGDMQVLRVLPLSQKQQLFVVALFGQVYILAVGLERVEVIEKITDPETLQRLLTPQPDVFRDKFLSFLKKPKKDE